MAMVIAGAVLFSALPTASHAQEGLLPGEGFVTKFSGTTTVAGAGGPRTVIDLAGTVGTAIDLRQPGFPADGRHWLDEPHLFSVTASDVGQVFGVTLDDANPPNMYLTATSAFGLHRNADSTAWMDGMWGPGGGPGTVYRLNAAADYRAEILTEITLEGRANSGAALGNIAFDRQHHQLFVSDIETGMIHRIAVADGADLGSFDHGVTGRGSFVDAASGASLALAPVAFDPATSAHVADCPSGDFARTPSCWNFADFRRRVWGLDVRHDPDGNDVRLYYAVWGSQGFGNPDWSTAGEDQQNSVWSIAIADDGGFDTTSIRREFFVPEFFRSPAEIARAGISNPVADIAFSKFGNQAVMLIAERGGIRNLGLSAENAFAYPHEARVLRYAFDAGGNWQPAGRYDVGSADRKNEGPPYVRAGAAGGAAFGMGYDASGRVDPARTDAFVWMTGDGLCAPDGPCLDPATGTNSDVSEVTGLQGVDHMASEEVIPDAAFRPYPAPGPAYPAAGPDQSYMIDADINVNASGAPIPEELERNDATRVGDVVVYQQAAAKPDLQIVKRALDPSCAAGADCRFAITITNVGDVPYSGPLALRDTPVEGATLSIPPAPDWTCTPLFAGIQECSHAPVDLAPGAQISFQVAVRVPTWWNRSVLENCVDLTTPGAGQDARTYNNSACGYGPTAEPDTPYYAPDLRLTKFGLFGQCNWAGDCWFAVRIANVGAAPYTGPLSFHDEMGFPGAALAGWGPDPGWVCGPLGGNVFTCTHAPVTLGPGDFRDVVLRFTAPPPTPGHIYVTNCGRIEWGGLPRDYNPGNEYDCASISRFPPGHPDARPILDIAKKAVPICEDGDGPSGGWACRYIVEVTNIGGAPFIGPITISDTTTGPVATLTETAVPGTCVPGIGSAGPWTCTYPPVPGGLQPGQTATIWFEYEAPGIVALPNTLQNCATIAADHDGDGVAENHTRCAVAVLCHMGTGDCPKDLAILKTSLTLDPCYPGTPCRFIVELGNIGGDTYHGPVNVTEIPDSGVGPLSMPGGGGGFVCVPTVGTNYLCSFPGDIPAGAVFGLGVDFPIPAGYPATSFKNCVQIPAGPENQWIINDVSCATAYVPFPDMHPVGGTECKRGADCTLDLGMENSGLLPFIGSTGVRGTLSPAVPIVSITPQTPGVTCRVTGEGTYECLGRNLTVQPGDTVKWQAVIHIAEDFPADQITHTKDMVWPDRKVKDKRPENDRNVSIITIEGPKEPPPPQQPTEAATPDLAISKALASASCVAGRPCPFNVTIRNVGAGPYVGPLRIDDITTPANTSVASAGPPPWSCSGSGGHYSCTYPATTLAPGETRTLSLTLNTRPSGVVRLTNCASFAWDDAQRVMAVQNALNELGFPAGKPDGKAGPQTMKAVAAYQERIGVAVTGRIDGNLLKRLFGTWGDGDASSANDRACVTTLLKPAPLPPVRCTGGTVQNNQCICPQGSERQQVGTNAYRCMPTIICEGGKIDNNRCYCPRGTVVQQIGTDAYRCVKPQPQITCEGGKVDNDRCYCPRDTEVQQIGTNAYRCVTRQPSITCTGGKVDHNECICPRGTEAQQVGTNAYRCVKTSPLLVCLGGSISREQCFCPKGTERQQVGPSAYRCVAVQPVAPTLQCSGGTVQHNECVCPRGMEAQRVRINAYRCVKSQSTTPSFETPMQTAPTIICSGGSVRNGRCFCPQGSSPQEVGKNAYRCAPMLQLNPQFQLIVPQLRVLPRVQ